MYINAGFVRRNNPDLVGISLYRTLKPGFKPVGKHMEKSIKVAMLLVEKAAIHSELGHIETLLKHHVECPRCNKKDPSPLLQAKASAQADLADIDSELRELKKHLREMSEFEGLVSKKATQPEARA